MGLLVCGLWCGDVEMGGCRWLDVWVGMMARGWMLVVMSFQCACQRRHIEACDGVEARFCDVIRHDHQNHFAHFPSWMESSISV